MTHSQIVTKWEQSCVAYIFWLNHKTADDSVCDTQIREANEDNAYWYKRLKESAK